MPRQRPSWLPLPSSPDGHRKYSPLIFSSRCRSCWWPRRWPPIGWSSRSQRRVWRSLHPRSAHHPQPPSTFPGFVFFFVSGRSKCPHCGSAQIAARSTGTDAVASDMTPASASSMALASEPASLIRPRKACEIRSPCLVVSLLTARRPIPSLCWPQVRDLIGRSLGACDSAAYRYVSPHALPPCPAPPLRNHHPVSPLRNPDPVTSPRRAPVPTKLAAMRYPVLQRARNLRSTQTATGSAAPRPGGSCPSMARRLRTRPRSPLSWESSRRPRYRTTRPLPGRSEGELGIGDGKRCATRRCS